MKKKLLLGYDIGSSSVKASVIDADSGELVTSESFPEVEMKINSPEMGWAEQNPDEWWKNLVVATQKIISHSNGEVAAIGISYQMHGLVLVDVNKDVLYPSIIWCDSRAVEIGDSAFNQLGGDLCLSNFLNSPGNFTASKFKWIKENRPEVYEKTHKMMLPGDYIAMKLSDEITTTVSGLSEGVLWNFKEKQIGNGIVRVLRIKC